MALGSLLSKAMEKADIVKDATSDKMEKLDRLMDNVETIAQKANEIQDLKLIVEQKLFELDKLKKYAVYAAGGLLGIQLITLVLVIITLVKY